MGPGHTHTHSKAHSGFCWPPQTREDLMPDADTACRCADRCPLLKPLLASIWPKETWLIFSLAQRIFPCLHLPKASQYGKVTALNQISVCSSAGWKCDNEVEFYAIRFPYGGGDKDVAGMLLLLSCSFLKKCPARHLWFIMNRYQHLILAYSSKLSCLCCQGNI